MSNILIFLASLIFATVVASDLRSNLKLFRNCLQENGLPSDSLIRQNSNFDCKVYEGLNHQWNLRLPKVEPLGYFLPTSTQDVQLAVWCGRKANVPLIPKSGGHSYESISDGNSETVVLDFRRMTDITIDPIEETVRIEPGAVVGTVNAKLWKSGGFGIPMGNCFTVGIGGTAIGGGFGFFTPVYGLTLDNILEITMVDADGVVHTVSPGQNTDLFWALRGVGSGYIGIVTSFKFKMFQASKIKQTFMRKTYRLEEAPQVLKAWQKWMTWTQEHEPTVFSTLFITGKTFNETHIAKYSSIGNEIEVHSLHIQDEKRQPLGNENFLKMFHQIFPNSENLTPIAIHPSYIEFVVHTSYIPIVTTKPRLDIDLMGLRNETSLPRYFKEKSFYVDKSFGAEALEKVGDFLQSIPDRNVWIMFASEGGREHNVSSKSTAFVHRKATYSISAHYEGSNTKAEVDTGIPWLYQFMKEIEFMDSGETYQNYLDADLKDYLKRYYGENLQKLIYVKQSWDPSNYFRNPVSLPVS